MPAGIKMIITEDKEVIIKGTPKVPFNQSKKLVSQDGKTVIYFIKREYGWKHKLDSKMNFANPYPMDKSFCEITIPIERV